MNLNPEQREAVAAGPGVWRVEAGAGAGKTRVLVERYRRLVLDEGALENSVLCLTFTRSAADEMRQRANAVRNGRGGFRTFHSLALALVTVERDALPFRLGDDPIPQNGQIPRLLRKILRGLRGVTYRDSRNFISLKKRAGLTPAQAIAQAHDAYEAQLAQVYAEYDRAMRAEGWLDFESMQMEAERLLASNADVRARWQFAWVQIDEAQDCEPIQWRIAKLVSEQSGNVFAVGDINQCIYEWRAASPSLFLNLAQLFPSVRTLYLPVNYRSTQAIVDFCREVAPVKTGLVERLRAAGDAGEPPEVAGFATDSEEADTIIGQVVQRPEAAAVLVRTNRQLRALEDACLARGIRYTLLGRSGFWQRQEVQDVLAFLRFLERPADDEAVRRIVRSPYPCAKYLGTAFLKTLPSPLVFALARPPAGTEAYRMEAARRLSRTLSDLRDATRELPVPRIVEEVIARSGMEQYFRSDDEDSDADNWALDNLAELVQVAARFRTAAEMIAHAERALRAAASKTQQGVTLSTVHQAKGREWETVFVAGVTDEILPHKNGELEEERRIFYVACSRAARRLVIAFHGKASMFVPGPDGAAAREQVAEIPRTLAQAEARRSFPENGKRPVPFDQMAKALSLF